MSLAQDVADDDRTRQQRSALLERTIDVVALNYWPEQFGIAPYATQLAEHLAAVGARVTAYVGMPHYPAWSLEPEYRRKVRSREKLNGVQLRRLRHFVPARQTALRRATYEATFLGQSMTVAGGASPDLVVAVIPSLGGGIAGALRARRHRVPFAIFVQDLVGAAAAQSGISGGASVAALTSRVEMWLLRQAEVVAVLNEAFRAQAIAAGVDPRAVVVLPNWSHAPDPLAPRDVVRDQMCWPDGTAVVLHAGNMGLKQDLGNVVEAARLAEQQGHDVLFVLMGDGSQKQALQEQGRGLSTLRFTDSMFGQDYVDALAAADVLLVNEKDTVVDMSLPSKLTSYFRAGRPVLAASVDVGTTASQVTRSGGGIVVPPAQPQALLDAAVLLAGDAETSASLGAAGRDFSARELDRSIVLGKFEDLFARAIAAGRRR
jgi:colanic acid biosynthesis glycosyl transferase WcaI